MLVHFGDDLT